MFGRKPADGVGGGSSANAQSTPPAKKGFAAGLFGTSATPRSAPDASKPAPRTPQADLRDDDLPGMFTRATTLLENVQRRVSASSGAQGAKGTADDADNARQFMRVNEVKRLTTRIRVGLETLAVAGEKGAWEAQLAFLESETATAVEAVLRVASPAPAETRPSERRNETTTGEAKTLNMFAGLNVSPAPPTTTTQSRMRSASPSPVSPSPKSAVTGVPSTSAATPAPAPTASLALGGGDGGLFSGLDVSPAPRPASPGTRTSTGTRTSSGTPPPPPQPPASPGISIELPPPPLDASAFSMPATNVPSSPTTETEPPAAPTGSAAERDGTGSAAPSPGPKRRPRVRVGYARDEDAARGLGVEQPTIPAGGSETNGSGARADVDDANDPGAETRARPDVDDAKAGSQADPLEREMSQKAEVVRRWKAAVVIQSRYRGRRGRAEVSKMLAAMAAATAAAAQADLERAAAASRAATRIQAAHRARAARAEVQKMRSAAKAAAAKAAAAEAEIRAAEAAEAAAAAEEEAAKAEAAEHRVREAAASRIQAALRGRAARFEVSRRRVAAAAARAAAAQAEVEEWRARDAAATRIQSARRARAARVEFEKRRNAARLADSLRDESIFDADAKREAARDAVADRRLESLEGRSTDERRMSGEDVQPASLKKDEEGAGPSEAAAEAGTDDENGSVLDKAATLGVAAATAAATEVLEHARVPLKGADTVETLANALDRAAAAFSHAAREARRCVSAAEPKPAAEARGATPPNPGGAAAPPSFDLISF